MPLRIGSFSFLLEHEFENLSTLTDTDGQSKLQKLLRVEEMGLTAPILNL